MDRVENYLKANPDKIKSLKEMCLKNSEFIEFVVLFEALRDLEDEIATPKQIS